MKTRKFYVIDGHGMIHRAFHSPLAGNLTTKCGWCGGTGVYEETNNPRIPGQGGRKCPQCNGTGDEPTKATFVFTKLLLKMVREHRPDYLVFAHDGCPREHLHRTKLFHGYKGNRKPGDWELSAQMRRIKQLVKLLGIPLVCSEGHEADDVIATLVDCARGITGLETIIVSRDGDLAQLIGEGVRMYDALADEFLDGRWVYKKFGVHPTQVVDWKAMVGDPGDNYPGVPGIGEKGATEILTKHITAEQFKKNMLAELFKKPGAPFTKAEGLLQNNWKAFNLSKQLAQLDSDVELDGLESFEQLEFKGLRMKKAKPLFEQLGFRQWS
jgi:5'-3' exonuclease